MHRGLPLRSEALPLGALTNTCHRNQTRLWHFWPMAGLVCLSTPRRRSIACPVHCPMRASEGWPERLDQASLSQMYNPTVLPPSHDICGKPEFHPPGPSLRTVQRRIRDLQFGEDGPCDPQTATIRKHRKRPMSARHWPFPSSDQKRCATAFNQQTRALLLRLRRGSSAAACQSSPPPRSPQPRSRCPYPAGRTWCPAGCLP